MEERNDEMQVVEVNENEGYDGYEMTEYSEESEETELDLTKILMWGGIAVAAIGGIVIANKDRIKEARLKRKEKKMRKYADELGYNVVDPDDYVDADYNECDVEEDIESDEE